MASLRRAVTTSSPDAFGFGHPTLYFWLRAWGYNVMYPQVWNRENPAVKGVSTWGIARERQPEDPMVVWRLTTLKYTNIRQYVWHFPGKRLWQSEEALSSAYLSFLLRMKLMQLNENSVYRSKTARKVFLVKMDRDITARLQKKEKENMQYVVYREKHKSVM